MPLAPTKPAAAPAPGPYAIERIEKEIAHLRQREAARHGPGQKRTRRLAWMFILLGTVLLGLFFMDPAMHALRRYEAIHAYLYLHHYGSEKRANELLASQIFSPNEIVILNRRQGDFHEFYASPVEANHAEEGVVSYLQGVDDLHHDKIERLNALGKIRFNLFVRFGIDPPIQWALLDPAITG